MSPKTAPQLAAPTNTGQPLITVAGVDYELRFLELLPRVPEAKLAEMRQDMRLNGIKVRISAKRIVDEMGNVSVLVVDGNHRVLIAKEEGLTIPIDFPKEYVDMTDEELELRAFALNDKRRHLDAEELAKVAARLEAEGLSRRAAAAKLGVPESTLRDAQKRSVARDRATDQPPAKVTGTDSKTYPTAKRSESERQELAKRAHEMQSQGSSLNEIKDELGVSKGTAHTLVKSPLFTPLVLTIEPTPTSGLWVVMNETLPAGLVVREPSNLFSAHVLVEDEYWMLRSEHEDGLYSNINSTLADFHTALRDPLSFKARALYSGIIPKDPAPAPVAPINHAERARDRQHGTLSGKVIPLKSVTKPAEPEVAPGPRCNCCDELAAVLLMDSDGYQVCASCYGPAPTEPAEISLLNYEITDSGQEDLAGLMDQGSASHPGQKGAYTAHVVLHHEGQTFDRPLKKNGDPYWTQQEALAAMATARRDPAKFLAERSRPEPQYYDQSPRPRTVTPAEEAEKPPKKPRGPHSFSDIDFANWKAFEDLLTTSWWDLGPRAKGPGRKGDYHGNFVPQIPDILMRRFTQAGDVVADFFLGGGTAMVEALRLGRHFLGFDLQPGVVAEAKQLLTTLENPYGVNVDLHAGDSSGALVAHLVRLELERLGTAGLDHFFLHPPYWQAIRFAQDEAAERDLSWAPTLDEFKSQFRSVVWQALALLKPGKFFTLVMGDCWANSEWITLGSDCKDVIKQVGGQGVKLKGHVVKKIQGNEKGAGKNAPLKRYRALWNGTFEFSHEHIYIFQKVAEVQALAADEAEEGQD